MNSVSVLTAPLRQLEAAIDDQDAPRILRALGGILPPLGALYATPLGGTPAERASAEMGKGDRLLLAERCIDKLKAMPTLAGLAGIPFDVSAVAGLLSFLANVLRAKKPVPALVV